MKILTHGKTHYVGNLSSADTTHNCIYNKASLYLIASSDFDVNEYLYHLYEMT